MNKTWMIVGIVVVAGGIGWYAVSPLFNTLKTDEAVPVDSGAMLKKEDAMMSASTTAPSNTMTKGSNQAMMAHERTGTVMGTLAHPASGTVRTIHADGRDYVRYENLKTINGPDIYVYLSKDLGAKDYVSLGKVKSTEGNSNYEIPAGTNAADYPYVLIWCRQFGVLFNSAELKA